MRILERRREGVTSYHTQMIHASMVEVRVLSFPVCPVVVWVVVAVVAVVVGWRTPRLVFFRGFRSRVRCCG